MKARLIVNPVAGRDAAPDALQVINRGLREKVGALDIVLTIGPGDARETAAAAVRAGYDTLFVAGGDGTLNEVVNGVASVDDALGAVTFGVIPLGTGNDFATALGMPREVEGAVQALVPDRWRAVDLGRVAGQWFVNVSAGGFVAEVSENVNPQLKSIAGRMAYLIGGAQVLWDYTPVEVRATLETQSGTVEMERLVQLFAVCNGPTFGGGGRVAPDAVLDDGWLDLCMIEAMPVPEFVAMLPALSRGEHTAHERVSCHRVRRASFDFSRPMKINTDGEVLTVAHCEYEVLPRATRFFVPG